MIVDTTKHEIVANFVRSPVPTRPLVVTLKLNILVDASRLMQFSPRRTTTALEKEMRTEMFEALGP